MRGLALALAVSLFASVGAATSQACSRVQDDSPPTAKQRVRSFDYAIYGRVVSVKSPQSGRVEYEATIRVHRVYRGSVRSMLRVRYTTQTSACGTTLKAGRRIGLVFDEPGPPFHIGSGNRITLRELDRATGGRFRRPARS